MSRRQCAEGANEIANLWIGGLETEPSAELLEHVDTSASVGRVHHEMHRSIRFEQTAQSSEACIRVGKVVQNSGADDLVETGAQVFDTFDGKLVDLKIFQVVFLLQFLGMAHAGCAAVDSRHLCRGPAQCMF